MPQGQQDFASPFRFLLRPGDRPQRRPAPDRAAARGYAGILECRLTAFSLLETRGVAERDGRKVSFADHPVIPGTTLKGMVRSIVEFVGGGCFPVKDGQVNVPGEWRACRPGRRGAEVCPACAMFGIVNGGSVLKGVVSFSDATTDANHVHFGRKIRLDGASPHPKTRLYPRNGPWQKFYHHQPARRNDPIQASRRAREDDPLQPALAGSRWSFRVRFVDLAAKELALLHYALALQPGMLHKLGRGKPQGMGSVLIEVTRVEVWDEKKRLLGGGATYDELPDEVLAHRKQIEEDKRLEPLRLMLWWREEDKLSYRYPTRDEARRAEGLREVQELYQGLRFSRAELRPPELPAEVVGKRRERSEPVTAHTYEIGGCLLIYNPSDGSIVAKDGEGKVVGLAAHEDARRVLAAAKELGEHLKKKKRLKGVTVTVEQLGRKKSIVRFEKR